MTYQHLSNLKSACLQTIAYYTGKYRHSITIFCSRMTMQLGKWANTWGMNFNTNKCHILSIKNKFFYSLNNETLEYVTTNPYHGITISRDLKWHSHISTITKKANSTLGFLRRYIRRCPINSKRTTWIALVRAVLEYGAIVCDPYHRGDIDKLEKYSTPCSSLHHWRLPL